MMFKTLKPNFSILNDKSICQSNQAWLDQVGRGGMKIPNRDKTRNDFYFWLTPLHLRSTFNKINGYPHSVITQIVKRSHHTPIPPLSTPPPEQEENNDTPSTHLIVLPYKGRTGELIQQRHDTFHKHNSPNHSRN